MLTRAAVLTLVDAITPLESGLARLVTLAKGRPNPSAAAWADDNAGAEIADVSSAVRRDVRDLVTTALEEGWRTDQLASELEALGFDADRADTIAGQELRTARHAARLETWQGREDADEARKVWVVSANPCRLCRAIAGQTQFLDEPFDTELGPVDHPPLHVSCRCSMRRVAA